MIKKIDLLCLILDNNDDIKDIMAELKKLDKRVKELEGKKVKKNEIKK